jgi:hypothetical protein
MRSEIYQEDSVVPVVRDVAPAPSPVPYAGARRTRARGGVR